MSIPTWLSEPRILGALVVFGLVEDNPGGVVRVRSCRVGPLQHEIDLPVDRIPARLLVKCEAPHLFFDEAGWREIPLQGRREQLRTSRVALAGANRRRGPLRSYAGRSRPARNWRPAPT